MRLTRFVLALVVLMVVACTTPDTPKVDSSGMVRISSKEPGDLYAHPARSIDDYDNFLLGDVTIASSPQQ